MKSRTIVFLVAALAITTPKLSAVKADTKPLVRLEQSDARLAHLEELVLSYVNKVRTENKLPELKWNAKLAEVARAHSAEMRDLKYFKHESPTPGMRDPLDRYRKAFGDAPWVVAENIFRSYGGRHEISDEDAKRAHDSLMNSPGHKANILRKGVTEIGIGFVANANGDLWVTQMFIRP